MRVLFGLLLLVGAFLAAAGWQGSRTATVRAAREYEHGLSGGDRDPAWSLLVLGNISGAEPIPGAEPPPPLPPEGEPDWTPPGGGDAPPQSSAHPRYAPDYRYVVQPGDVLGKICQAHYGTAKAALVQAVAHYNGLPSPDAIRVDDPVLLPDRVLLGK